MDLFLLSALVLVLIVCCCVYTYVILPITLSDQLAHSGWVVYLKDGCSFCKDQMGTLGWKFRNFVYCNKEKSACTNRIENMVHFKCDSPLITGYPFWYNLKTKKYRAGYQSAGQLHSMIAECK